MWKYLRIDKEVLQFIYPGASEEELDREYDLYNGIYLFEKVKNNIPLKKEEVLAFIKRQKTIKQTENLVNSSQPYKDYNVTERSYAYLIELINEAKQKEIMKIQEEKTVIQKIEKQEQLVQEEEVKTERERNIFDFPGTKESRDLLHYLFHFCNKYPDDPKAKIYNAFLESEYQKKEEVLSQRKKK